MGVRVERVGSLSRIAKSNELGDYLEGWGESVLEAARSDPNEYYVSTLRMRRFVSSGPSGRVSVQIGAAPVIGSRVEAARGTLARALAAAGL